MNLRRKAGDNDQLFGSVTSGDVSDALAAKGFTMEKRKIQLPEPIKAIGEFEIPVKLHREVSATLKVAVQKVQRDFRSIAFRSQLAFFRCFDNGLSANICRDISTPNVISTAGR